MNIRTQLGHRRVWLAGTVFCTLLIWAGTASAQVDTGAIAGTVRDRSNAVIPGVKVTLLNQGTGFALSVVSDANGAYIFAPVRIGTYNLTAEYQGFEKATHADVTVSVQEQVQVDFTLQPGQVTETVTVTSTPPLLQTQNASVGQVVGAQEVNDLPLNGRNYTFLAQLSAGVSQEAPTGRGLEGSGTFVANGLSSSNNNYILDGIDNNNDSVDFLNGASFAIKPPVDAIQEFKVQTSNFSAEFGRAGGAVLNATIKSGTNQLHGDAWEFVRNDAFDAANFFENSPTHVNKGEFRQNQFGLTLGGPVYIPHVYNGRDKTFFFVDYEGTRIRQASPQVATVPTTAETGSGYTDLSDLITDQSGTRTDDLNRTFPLGTVFDPATTRAVTAGQMDPVTGMMAVATGYVRDPFPNNQLPANRLDPNAIKLLNLYPAPTGPGLFNNYTADRVIQNNTNQFDVRVDHNFNDKDQIFGRFSYADNPDFVPGPFTSYADSSSFTQDTFHNNSVSAAVSESHSFASSLINEVRIGYSRLATSQFQPFANTLGIPSQFGIQGIPQIPHNGGLPFINIEGLNNLGPAGFVPGERFSETTQITDNLTKIYGAHNFKGGFEFQHLRFPWFAPAYPRGYFGFDGVYTEVPSTGGGNTGLAQLLLSPTTTTVPNGINDVGGSDDTQASNFTGPDDLRNYYGLYFQDSWKVRPRLTIELGLRWEFFGQVREKFGAQANFIPGLPGNGAEYLIPTQRESTQLSPSFDTTLATDGIKLAYSSVPGLTDTPLDNFAPRVSIAYQITSQLVARAGYGIYYAGFSNIGGSPDIGSNYPFLFNFNFPNPDPGHPITYPNGTLGTLENGLSAIPLVPANVTAEGLALEGIQQGYKTPYTQEYNVSLQYQLTPNQTLQLGFLGNNSAHQETGPGLDENSEILPPGQNPQNFVAFPDFARGASYITTEGNGYYYGLQATFDRRFNQGLDFLANYTYSECRTDEANLLGIGNSPGYRAPYLPGFGIQQDYTRCGDESPNLVHISGIYQLPVGKGRRFASAASGVVDQFIGGWSLNAIVTLQDGFPFTIGCPIGTTADFGCNALLVPGQNMYAGPHNVNQWLNPAAFANPPVATTIGQTGYAPLGGAPGQFLSPGFHRLDMSLFKQFRTSERTHLEFRAEFFNLTNTPQFANPAFTDFTNTATFGQITSLRDGANDPRQIQFALKFYF
jgi:Carboxypeptidase regulatory-like domain/TonB-dependent Receptor Plug Domain/TonB dependent receptor